MGVEGEDEDELARRAGALTLAARYEASAQSGPGGQEGSREVSTLPARGPVAASWVDAACEQAARGYVAAVERLTWGLVRGVTRAEGGQAFKILGVGPALLRFGEVAKLGPGAYALPVEGGMLAKRAAGQLAFRWAGTEGGDRFETAVEGFYPRLVGPGATRVGRLFYRLTQQVAHRWVMRKFHERVASERPKLLGLEP